MIQLCVFKINVLLATLYLFKDYERSLFVGSGFMSIEIYM